MTHLIDTPTSEETSLAQVTLKPRPSSLHAGPLDLLQLAVAHQHAVHSGGDTSPYIDRLVDRFGLNPELADSILLGLVRCDVKADALVLHVPPRSLRYEPPFELSAEHPRSLDRSARMQARLDVFVGTHGDVEAALREWLTDLRVWCHNHGVSLYRWLDASYEQYMLETYKGLSAE